MGNMFAKQNQKLCNSSNSYREHILKAFLADMTRRSPPPLSLSGHTKFMLVFYMLFTYICF